MPETPRFNGTLPPAEAFRPALSPEMGFIDDAVRIAHEASRRSGAGVVVTLGEVASDVLSQTGTAGLLAATGEASAPVVAIAKDISQGQGVSEERFLQSVRETVSDTLIEQDPQSIVDLLRKLRSDPQGRKFFDPKNTKLLAEILNKGHELPSAAFGDRAVVAEAALIMSESMLKAALDLRYKGGWLKRRAANRLEKSARQASLDAYELLPTSLAHEISDQNGQAFNSLLVGRAIDGLEQRQQLALEQRPTPAPVVRVERVSVVPEEAPSLQEQQLRQAMSELLRDVPGLEGLLVGTAIGHALSRRFQAELQAPGTMYADELASKLRVCHVFAKHAVELAQFPGVVESWQTIQDNNPAVLGRLVDSMLTASPGTLKRAQEVGVLAELSPNSVDEISLARLEALFPHNTLSVLPTFIEMDLADRLMDSNLYGNENLRILKWVLMPPYDDAPKKMDILETAETLEALQMLSQPGNESLLSAVAFQLYNRSVYEAEGFVNESVQAFQRVPRVLMEGYSSEQRLDIWRSTLNHVSPLRSMELIGNFAEQYSDTFHRLAAEGDVFDKILMQYTLGANPSQLIREWDAVVQQTNLLHHVGPQGLAYGLRERILQPIIESRQPLALAKHFERQLVSGQPDWVLNFELANETVRQMPYIDGVTIHELPAQPPTIDTKTSQSEIDQMLEGELLKPIAEMTVDEKRHYLGGGLDEELSGVLSVKLSDLTPEVQRTILQYRLFETVERSRSDFFRWDATLRNITDVRMGRSPWQQGDAIHITEMDNFPLIMAGGNVSGEVLGSSIPKADALPFNVDLLAIDESLLALAPEERIKTLPSQYGDLILHYKRGPGSYREGEERDVSNLDGRHKALLVGIPSTEICAITLVDPSAQLGKAREILLEQDIYVPIYDTSGVLLFTPQSYHEFRADNNYDKIRPEIVRQAVTVPNSMKGTTKGGVVFMPDSQGNMAEHYTVFADPARGHGAVLIYTRDLNDRLWRRVRPDIVPETRLVTIGGRVARASKMVPTDGPLNDRQRNEGFALACFTSTHDDALNASLNVIPSGAVGVRVDNEGLDLLPLGRRKNEHPGEPFDGIVRELDSGRGFTQLALGMRQAYPGITDADIKTQIEELVTALPDEAIDYEVDNSRRSATDRIFLKQTLKERRDYMKAYADRL